MPCTMLKLLEKLEFSSVSCNEEDEYLTSKTTWADSCLGKFCENEKTSDGYSREARSILLARGDERNVVGLNVMMEKAKSKQL